MKKNEIQIGQTYTAKVSDKVVPVRIDAEHPRGGWKATNLATNKVITIKSAQRLRGRVGGGVAEPTEAGKQKLTAAQRKAMKAQAAADQENARARDERDASDDGMTASERAMTQSAPKKRRKAADPARPKKVSLLNAAAQVLADAKDGMNAKQMIEAVTAKGLWTPGAGKTPHATLYAAIVREIAGKGDAARFKKTDRGLFMTNG